MEARWLRRSAGVPALGFLGLVIMGRGFFSFQGGRGAGQAGGVRRGGCREGRGLQQEQKGGAENGLSHRINPGGGPPWVLIKKLRERGNVQDFNAFAWGGGRKVRVAPARARAGKARRPPFRPQLNEPNRQLSVTSTRSAGCLARCVAELAFGTEGDRKRTGDHGQGCCTSR